MFMTEDNVHGDEDTAQDAVKRKRKKNITRFTYLTSAAPYQSGKYKSTEY